MVSPVNLFAQQISVDIPETENAAVYYLKVFNLLEYPKSEAIKTQLQEIVKNGWQKDYPEIEKVLAENEGCLSEFKKGVNLESCDFYSGKEYKYLAQRELIGLMKVRNLSYLLWLKVRYHERQNDFDAAAGVCLSLLKFARHVSQDKAMVSRMLALATERGTYAHIKRVLGSGKVTQEIQAGIFNYLTKYDKERFPARELVEFEKDLFMSTVEMSMDEARQKAIKTREHVSGEMQNQARELADRYYGNFAKAMETNNDKDWEFATEEFAALKKDSKNTISNISGMIYEFLTKGQKVASAKILAKQMLAIAMPDFKRAGREYYLALEELREIESLASVEK